MNKELEALNKIRDLCTCKNGTMTEMDIIVLNLIDKVKTGLTRLEKLDKIVELLIKEPSIVSLRDKYNSIHIGHCMLQLPNEDYKYWKERFRNE